MPALIHHNAVSQMCPGSDLCSASIVQLEGLSVLYRFCTPSYAWEPIWASTAQLLLWQPSEFGGWVAPCVWEVMGCLLFKKKETGQRKKIQSLILLLEKLWGDGLFYSTLLKVLKMYLHHLIDYHDKKYTGGILLEAETAPECLAIILPL